MFYKNHIWLMEASGPWSDFVAGCSMVTLRIFCHAVEIILLESAKPNKCMEPTVKKGCRCDPFIAYYKDCDVHGWG